MLGIFGNLFDLNHDGKLDPLEQAMELSVFHEIIDNERTDDSLSVDDDFDSDLLDED